MHLVRTQKRVSVAEVCDEFGISLATARRDLSALSLDDKIQRIHGGALAKRNAPPEPPVSLHSRENVDEKGRISQAVASLIHDEATVFLGSGTTV